MNKKYKIVHLSKCAADPVVELELQSRSDQFERVVTTNKEEFQKAIAQYTPDIILANHEAQRFNYHEALHVLKQLNKPVPVLVMASSITPELLQQVEEGVQIFSLSEYGPCQLPGLIVNTVEKFLIDEERAAFARDINRFNALMMQSNDAVMILDAQGKLTYASPNVSRVLGYTAEEIVDLNIFNLAHPGDVLPMQAVLQQVLANPGVPIKGHTGRLKQKDGSWRWIEATATNLLHDPNINGIVDNFRDVTEQRVAQQKIINDERRFRALVENSADGIALIDATGKPLYISPSVHKVLGYTAAERLQLDLPTLTHPHDVAALQAIMQQVLSNPATPIRATARMLHKNKQWRWIEGTLTNLLHDPAVSGIVNNFRDVTGRVITEAIIKGSEEKYHSFFSNSMDGILLTVADGQILDANAAACQMFKMTRAEICAAGRHGLVAGNDPQLAARLHEREKMGRAKGELVFVRKDGSEFHGEVTSVIYKNAEGQPRTSIIIRDITERRVAEQKLIQTTQSLQLALDRLNKIMEASLDIICTLNEAGEFVIVSAAVESILGYTPDEIIGRPYLSFVCNQDIEGSLKAFDGVRKGGAISMFENRFVKKDGSLVPLYWSAKWESADGTTYAIGRDASEKKELENAIANERERFVEMFLTAPASVTVVKGPQHVFEMANDRFLKLTGKADIVGKSVKHIFPEVESQGLLTILDEVYKTGEAFAGYEQKIKFYEGHSGVPKTVYLNFAFKAFRNKKREVEGVFFFGIDVTEQVQSRKRIEQSEQQYRQIVETAQEGIWVLNEKGKTVFVNEKLCRLLEYDEDEMIGKLVGAFSSGPGQVRLQEWHQSGKVGISEIVETTFTTKSGNQLFARVSANAIFDERGVYTGSLGMITDITERKKSEEKLLEYQKQLLESQRIAHIGSWQVKFIKAADIAKCPLYCSEETLHIFGFNAPGGEISYRLFLKAIHPNDRRMVAGWFAKALTHMSLPPIGFRIVHPTQGIRWVYQEAIVETDAATGGVCKMFGTIKDITVRKEQELQIEKNNRERELLIAELTKSNHDLKQFSFITSHNFRAPLSNLIGLLGMLNPATFTSENRQIIEMFKASTLQLSQTINDLIQILIIKNNVNVAVAHLNTAEALNNALQTLSYELSSIDCTITTSLGVEHIICNRSYLDSIFTNLISNAIKYRSPGRPLKINIATSLTQSGQVLIIVSDNGLGIDLKRHKAQMFGMYQRFHSNDDSVGLGLFMLKSQIASMGGSIEVESEVDKGTSFFITLKNE